MRTIVSMTSYGERLTQTLPKALDSIYKMKDLNPDKVLLYLAKQDYELFDKKMLETYEDLEIRIVKDLKSYKKYFVLTESEFDNDFIFIADDDFEYNAQTWLSLKTLYNKNGNQNCIYTKTSSVSDGFFKPYFIPKNNQNISFDTFIFWSGCGMLIPPKVMRFDNSILEDGFNLGNNGGLDYVNDDNFLSVYCFKEGIKCYCVYSEQKNLDFKGNNKFVDTHKNKSKLHTQLSLRYFGLPEAEKIVVSMTTDNQSSVCDKITGLFENQTLQPDKVILTLNQDDSVKRKLIGLTKEYNLEIQKTTYNPLLKKWNPDNVEGNDLLFVIDDETDIEDTLLEGMFKEYFLPHKQNGKLKYIKGFGHRHLVNSHKEVVRANQMKSLDLNEDGDIEEIITKTILLNKK